MTDFDTAVVAAFEDALCSHAVTMIISGLRTHGIRDGDIAAGLLAGVRTLTRDLPNREAWSELLLETGAEMHGAANG